MPKEEEISKALRELETCKKSIEMMLKAGEGRKFFSPEAINQAEKTLEGINSSIEHYKSLIGNNA